MCDSLTPEQVEMFQFPSTGHNVFVTGQAGTGKLRVVNAIREHCQQLLCVRVESPAKCTILV